MAITMRTEGACLQTFQCLGTLHQTFIVGRRIMLLADKLAALLPPRARVLDVGCGDGLIDSLITTHRPDLSIDGIDVLVRANTYIQVQEFDGVNVRYPDASFDVVMFVDVLHHTKDPLALLREASRVANTILIKDHFRDGILADQTLRFMDWVGNARHGVALTYNYWSKSQWNDAYKTLSLKIECLQERLNLYPLPASWLFDRRLQFIARLKV